MRGVRARDAAVPFGLAGLGTAELIGLDVDGLAGAISLELAVCALLVLRRAAPFAVSTVAGVSLFLLPYLGPELDEPAVPILIGGLCLYTVGRWVPDLRGLATLAAFALVLLSDYAFTTDDAFDVSDLLFLSIVLVPPYAAGLAVRTLVERTRRLDEQAHELRRLQHAVRTEAAAAERGRIARELHDVIAHSVSAMVVQAAAASALVHTDPARAVVAADAVASTGRRALAETGRLLHLVRDQHDELGLAPQPGLAMLPELVEGFRSAGLDVTLELEGCLDGLPAGIDLSAYRIVQESLTNVGKHAPCAPARLRVHRDRHVLRIRTTNGAASSANPPRHPSSPGGAGLGLVGIAERVLVCGGRLSHGLDADGRWVLDAELPLPQDLP